MTNPAPIDKIALSGAGCALVLGLLLGAGLRPDYSAAASRSGPRLEVGTASFAVPSDSVASRTAEGATR